MGIEQMIRICGFYLLTLASITRGGKQNMSYLSGSLLKSNFSAIDFYALINKTSGSSNFPIWN